MKIPFNKPYLSGREEKYILEALRSRAHCGNHKFGQQCISLMKEKYGFCEVFLTTSCTSAMEMGAILAGLKPGDEVIMPSYTFSSTANAIVLQGAQPVFCEIEPDTMNIDVKRIPGLITEKTRMILPIDYAGIPCEIEPIMKIANQQDITVMKDAAQSFGSMYKKRPSGAIADLTAFSFHETKNTTCGEGGALVVNRREWIERAHFLQEKGTDRSLVLKGMQTKYYWVDKGSSFLLSDILAAMLLAQIEDVEDIMRRRSKVTDAYHELFKPYEKTGCLSIPHPPEYAGLNHHAFFVIFDKEGHQIDFLARCREKNIYPYIGYTPLHSAPMGRKFGYKPEDLPLTEDIASRIVRLPFYVDLSGEGLDYCIDGMSEVLHSIYGS